MGYLGRCLYILVLCFVTLTGCEIAPRCEFELTDFIAVINPGITIIGFIVTGLITKREIKEARNTKLSEYQKEVYIKCFEDIQSVIDDQSLVYNKNYIKKLQKHKATMKLVASSYVVSNYRNYFDYVIANYEKYLQFKDENDPREDNSRREIIFDEDGNELEDFHISEAEINAYETKAEEYKRENMPTNADINRYLLPLLNGMRKDLFNDEVNQDGLADRKGKVK